MRFLQRIRYDLAIKLTFGLAFVLRLINITGSNYWRDEAFTMNVVRGHDLLGIVRVAAHDTAPPLHFLLSKIVGTFFGYGEFPQRMISVLAGMGTLYFIWLIAEQVFKNKRLRLAIVLLAALNPLLIYYSQEARAYAILTLATSATIYFALKLQEQAIWRNYLGYLIFTLLGLYSHNIFLVVAVTTGLYLIIMPFYKKYVLKDKFTKLLPGKKFWLTILAIAIGYLPWLIMFLRQYQLVQSAAFWFKFDPLSDVVSNFPKFFTGELFRWDSKLLEQLLLPVLSGLGVLGLFFGIVTELRAAKKNFPTFTFFTLTMLGLVFILSFKTPFYYIRYLIFVTPTILFLCCLGYSKLRLSLGKVVRNGLFISLCAVSLGYSLLNINFNPALREDYTAAIHYLDYQASTDIVLMNNGLPAHGIKFYATWPSYIYAKPENLNYYEGLAAFTTQDYYQGSLMSYQRVWTVTLWEDPGFAEKITSQRFVLSKTQQFTGNVIVSLYTKI